MTFISVNDLSFAYRGYPIFSSVSFRIEQGSFVGIIGPNGGGKTTLLRLLLGFLEPQRGKIQIGGQSPRKSQSQIAYVPQAWKIDRRFPISVRELVLQGRLRHLTWSGRYREEDQIRVNEALEALSISHIAHRPLEYLSGGEIQRVLLARALVSDPSLLLLDEPTANIDRETEKKIYQTLRSLAGDLTLLMVTHDLQTAIHSVDQVLCVQNGVSLLSPDEVCKHFGVGLYHNPLLPEGESS